MSKLLLQKYENIGHEELNILLKKVGSESIFYDDNRLLSEDEIMNYKEEIGIQKEQIIPLMDCFNNEFLVFDIIDCSFKMYSIDDEILYASTNVDHLLNEVICASNK